MPILCFRIQRNKRVDYLEFLLQDGKFPYQLPPITAFYQAPLPIILNHGIFAGHRILEIQHDIAQEPLVVRHGSASWVLTMEISCLKYIFNTPIHAQVNAFFCQYPEAGRLYSPGLPEQVLPSPRVAYEVAGNADAAYRLKTYGKIKPKGARFYEFSGLNYSEQRAQYPHASIVRFALLMDSPLFFSEESDAFDPETEKAESVLFLTSGVFRYGVKDYQQQIPLSYN